MPDPVLELRRDDLARLVLSLIRAEQDDLIREKKLARACHIDACLGPLGGLSFEDLSVDEEQLGFDSLARLSLVERFNRFFGLSTTGIEDYLLVHRGLQDWVILLQEHFKLAGDDAQITFSTSGSTGPSTHQTHSLKALTSEVSAHLQGPLSFGPKRSRVLGSVPVHHIYGFIWAMLVPRALGIQALDLPSGAAPPLLREARGGDMIVTTPFGWSAFENSKDVFTDDVWGISSGAPTTPQTWRIARKLGLKRLIEIYGSSETAGVGWRSQEDAPYVLCSDIAVRTSSKSDPKLARTGVGELPLQDNLVWADGRQFSVHGRKDRRIQIGGVNVNLSDVCAVLEAVADVRSAVVRPEGERLKAFVVPKSPNLDLECLEDSLRRAVGALPAPARPLQFTFGSDLPRTSTGKLADWSIS